MYLRIVTTQKDPDSHQNTGVFQRAYDLYDLYESGGLELAEVSVLKASTLRFPPSARQIRVTQTNPSPTRSIVAYRAARSPTGDCRSRVWSPVPDPTRSPTSSTSLPERRSLVIRARRAGPPSANGQA
jgi:hypothetical protein